MSSSEREHVWTKRGRRHRPAHSLPERGGRRRLRLEQILIVAPPNAEIKIESPEPYPTHLFNSVAELESWLRSQEARENPIERFVAEALKQLQVDDDDLNADLRRVIGWVVTLPVVPALKRVEECARSSRSFYRHWAAAVPESPSRFLRRVRFLHATTLIANGMTVSGAARRAGFRSVATLNRAAAEFGSK